MNQEREWSPGSRTLVAALAVLWWVWVGWATVVAFRGGSLPLIDVEVDGGLRFGILWLLGVVTVGPLVTLALGLAVVPVMFAMEAVYNRRRRS